MKKICECGATCANGNRTGRCWRCWDRWRADDTRARWGLRIMAQIGVAVGQAVIERRRAEDVVRASDRLARTSERSEWWTGDMVHANPRPHPTATKPAARDRALRLIALRGDVVLSGCRGIVLRRAGRGHIIAAQPQEGAQR